MQTDNSKTIEIGLKKKKEAIMTQIKGDWLGAKEIDIQKADREYFCNNPEVSPVTFSSKKIPLWMQRKGWKM